MRNAASRKACPPQRTPVARRSVASPGDAGAPRAEGRDQLRARIQRPLVLVGMMGAGKSTIGRRLAAALDFSFADADEEIVEAAQMSIPEIFDAYGEPSFRDGERRVIARMLEGGPRIIATGGGAFALPETRALILERGTAIWLDSDLDTLVERVTRKDTRPLLRGGNPRAILERLLEERRPAYAQAPIRVMSDAGPLAETVSRILVELDAWL